MLVEIKSIIAKVERQRKKATVDFAKTKDFSLYSVGYERGYDNALSAVIERLKESAEVRK